ncbi:MULTISPECIES: methylmalonyl-CoA epimerase [Erythrobacter]|uniref:Methylmalonyl-CoA epimerase n=1 Tax=Erythrobacter mangrovi TaxID=2739433 RepID=A0A7D4BV50_9SPHN|nr:methylmalonyl-CoA epimerase [Erythrobacter mangrovi]QKG71367.1 methylmalonyl-CoA epimerase [Erythrobacter mangrovi]
MKLGRLNHVGVATPSIEESIRYYRDVMGATSFHKPFDLEAQGVKVCFVDTPGENDTHGTQIELIEPLGPDSPIAKFLENNPSGGQHHLCYEVEDIEEARSWFEGMGKRILGPTRIGAHGTPIFFLHPKDMMGQLTEIMETPKGDSHWSN